MTRRVLATLLPLLLLLRAAAEAASPSPGAAPPAPSTSPALASPPSAATATPTPAAVTASPRLPSPTPTRGASTRSSEAAGVEEAAPDGTQVVPTMAPVAPGAAPPRAFRTPERAAAPRFVAPQGGATDADADMGAAAPPAPAVGGADGPLRSGSQVVIFRVSARTIVEGFDLRISYPRTAGLFGTVSHPAECSAGTGLIVAANDRGAGEMRLLVASAQALPFPLDVFCRFTTTGGSVGAQDFGVRVAEVTSDAKRADPGLLLVSVVVR